MMTKEKKEIKMRKRIKEKIPMEKNDAKDRLLSFPAVFLAARECYRLHSEYQPSFKVATL